MDHDEVRSFATPEELAAWIGARADDDPGGVWLRVPRAGSSAQGIGYAEALQVALAHGWIDGQKRSGDDPDVWLQRFVPRRRRSIWSQVNRDHAERLIAEGRMTPRGLAEVEAAKADGRWDAAYAPPSTAEVPDDLAAALDSVPGARAFFDALDSRNRYAVLHRVATARRPETRARRIEQYAAMLGNHEKLYP